MKRIAIVASHTPNSQQVAQDLRQRLSQLPAVELTTHTPDIVISVGGDGTLLDSFHHYSQELDRIRFIGVHTGHLGFYTDWRDYELPDLVTSIQQDTGQSADYPLLAVEIYYRNQVKPMRRELALNEATLRRGSFTMRTEVYIRDQFFESFRGDGICVSTPTGSTAYSKSLGGAVLHPRLAALQLTEIASINNRVFRTLSSPMVIPPDEWITLFPENDERYMLTLDQNQVYEEHIEKIRYQIAPEKIHFAKYRHMHFWSRVEDSFIGSLRDDPLQP